MTLAVTRINMNQATGSSLSQNRSIAKQAHKSSI